MKIEKLVKKLPVGFADEAEAMSEEQLRAAIVDADTAIRETENEREQDETLAAAKERVSDLSAAYRDVITAQRAKVGYCLYILDSKGKLGIARAEKPAKSSPKKKGR